MSRKVEIEFREDTFHSSHWGFHGFSAKDLEKTKIFQDVRVYTLLFFSNDHQDELQSWADPIRAIVLERLSFPGWNWYLSFKGWMMDVSRRSDAQTIEEDFYDLFQKQQRLNSVDFQIVEYGEEISRMYIETPVAAIKDVVMRYWSKNTPASPIQGLLLPAGNIAQIKNWNEQPGNLELFREILDHTRLFFYGFPSENYHLSFITDKLSFEEMVEVLDLEDLIEKASHLSIN